MVTRCRRRFVCGALMTIAWMVTGAAGIAHAAAHPLHTTMAEITVDPTHHTIRVVVRMFAEDLGQALARAGRAGADSPGALERGAAYVASAFGIRDVSGRPVALTPCPGALRRTGNLLWVCLESAPLTTMTLEVRDQLFCELFGDQVNLVQAVIDGHHRSILFTRGDGMRRL